MEKGFVDRCAPISIVCDSSNQTVIAIRWRHRFLTSPSFLHDLRLLQKQQWRNLLRKGKGTEEDRNYVINFLDRSTSTCLSGLCNRERKFDIEDGSLEGMYKNWQKKLHPDLVHTKSKEEREYAAEQSARVIDAYTTLRKPLSRAIYLMRLEGVEVDEEQTVSEPELLGEIMEIREAVEEATDYQALNKIHSQMEEKLRHWSNSFADAFGSKIFDEALKSIQRMTYYHRVNEEIIKKL